MFTLYFFKSRHINQLNTYLLPEALVQELYNAIKAKGEDASFFSGSDAIYISHQDNLPKNGVTFSFSQQELEEFFTIARHFAYDELKSLKHSLDCQQDAFSVTLILAPLAFNDPHNCYCFYQSQDTYLREQYPDTFHIWLMQYHIKNA